MATLESKKAATLGKRSIIGMILGLALGAILCFVPNGYVRDDTVINTILNIVGNGYLNLIKMTIIPFVFASLVMGISSATDVKQVGRIGGKILIIYVATTVIASAFGILGGMILKPGVGVDLGSFDLSNTYENVNTSFASVILDFIPTNIVESFAKGKMIHIVVFAVFFGIALSLIGEKAAAVKAFNESLANTMLKIVNIVMQLTPYGVCALMAKTVANLGFTIIVTLAKYCASEIFLLFLFGLIVYGLMLKIFTGLSYGRFLRPFVSAGEVDSYGFLPSGIFGISISCGVKNIPMIYQHALKYFVIVLFIHSLFQRFRGQFDRVIHRPNRLLDLLIPDLFLRIQTLICKTRASLL